ncbi:hypothetical protein PoB_005651200 [Plakobranchus ocellatus]|uniref:Uncharacterized protein n=1 Tax=Plakobranchus ocellatus TaxID=259542 RepID=A0AAV4CF71_9GAST|nr:hypothetical protein PoB_005651200 [Plakobranchus ocellatus]
MTAAAAAATTAAAELKARCMRDTRRNLLQHWTAPDYLSPSPPSSIPEENRCCTATALRRVRDGQECRVTTKQAGVDVSAYCIHE